MGYSADFTTFWKIVVKVAQITQDLDTRCKICQDKSYRAHLIIIFVGKSIWWRAPAHGETCGPRNGFCHYFWLVARLGITKTRTSSDSKFRCRWSKDQYRHETRKSHFSWCTTVTPYVHIKRFYLFIYAILDRLANMHAYAICRPCIKWEGSEKGLVTKILNNEDLWNWSI